MRAKETTIFSFHHLSHTQRLVYSKSTAEQLISNNQTEIQETRSLNDEILPDAIERQRKSSVTLEKKKIKHKGLEMCKMTLARLCKI